MFLASLPNCPYGIPQQNIVLFMDAMAHAKLMYLSRITSYKFWNLRKLRNIVDIYIT